jgi:hypothetical protein
VLAEHYEKYKNGRSSSRIRSNKKQTHLALGDVPLQQSEELFLGVIVLISDVIHQLCSGEGREKLSMSPERQEERTRRGNKWSIGQEGKGVPHRAS